MMPPSGVHIGVYMAWWSAMRARSFVTNPWIRGSAPGPAMSNSPMWDTSNRPARVRTARCSSMMPVYCTGISHPLNGTMRAPAATWAG